VLLFLSFPAMMAFSLPRATLLTIDDFSNRVSLILIGSFFVPR